MQRIGLIQVHPYTISFSSPEQSSNLNLSCDRSCLLSTLRWPYLIRPSFKAVISPHQLRSFRAPHRQGSRFSEPTVEQGTRHRSSLATSLLSAPTLSCTRHNYKFFPRPTTTPSSQDSNLLSPQKHQHSVLPSSMQTLAVYASLNLAKGTSLTLTVPYLTNQSDRTRTQFQASRGRVKDLGLRGGDDRDR